VSLLRDIQNDATSDDASITVLLRRCMILATRLQHEPLKEWARLEMDGYPEGTPLPSYRPQVATQVLGDFAGPFGSEARNKGLPESAVAEELRVGLFRVEVREKVAQIEALVASGETQFVLPWPTDVVAAYQDHFMEMMTLVSARQVVPSTVFIGVLSGIRDRIVQFALEIEELDPAAGEAAPGQAPIEQGQVTQIFNQTFHGDNTAFAAGGRDVHQAQAAVDISAVRQAAAAFGIDADEQEALATALDQDGGVAGVKTRAWIERLKAGAVTIGSGVATGTVVAALQGVLHLH
jgi:hypothetical protein